MRSEDDSLAGVNDDLLFGSGSTNWNSSSQAVNSPSNVNDNLVIRNQLNDLHIDGIGAGTTHTEPDQPRPPSQGAEGGARPKVNNIDRSGAQTNTVRNETRNKSAKDKENKHKNSKKRENSLQNGWFHDISRNDSDPEWSPALRLVDYNHAVRKNGGNGAKHKKQTMNEKLANNSLNTLGSVSLHSNSKLSARSVIQDTPTDQVCANDIENESVEFLGLPGIDPNSDPRQISRIYVPANRPGHVIPPNSLTDLNTESNDSVSENTELKDTSVNRIHNNLWENSKNCNIKEMSNVQNGLRLNTFRNDVDIDSDALPLARADLPGFHRQSSNSSLSSEQIVNHFPGSNISASSMNGHTNSPTIQQSSDSQITVPYFIPSEINLESLQSNLPTDLFFGDGNCHNDFLYAQQLQMQYDKQNSDYQTQMQYDDFTNMDYLNLSGEQRRGIASKQINTARRNDNTGDRVMNDVYDPGLIDDSLSDSLFMTGGEVMDDTRTISPDIRYDLPVYPDPRSSPSNNHRLRGQSFEDEQLARQIAEQFRLKEDEELARQLQMQDEYEERARQPRSHRRPDINEFRENSEPLYARYNRTWHRPLTVPTHRPSDNVYDTTIRGSSSSDRPLGRQTPHEYEYLEHVHTPSSQYRQMMGAQAGQYEFNPDYMLDDYGEDSLVSISYEYLEHVHTPSSQYRQMMGARAGQYEFNPDYMLDDYGEDSLVSISYEYLEHMHAQSSHYRQMMGARAGQYEFNPDYMLDDYGEDSLVSISRDPRMLATLLMERAPDMMIPNEIDLNDYERDPRMLATLLMERAPDMMIPNEIDLNDYEALWELAEGLGEVKRVGMELSEIQALPVHTYKGPSGSEDNKTDCLVCLSEFKKGEELRTLPCCHIYHVKCIDEWLKRNAICPVCRQSASQRG